MIHEWRSYRLKPGAAIPYLELLADHGLPFVSRHLPLMGYWLAETGPLNTIHHLWSYTDWAEREACRAALAKEDEWVKEFIPRAFPLVEEQQNRMLRLSSGSGLFEKMLVKRREPMPAREAGSPLFAGEFAAIVNGEFDGETVAAFQPLSGDPSLPLALLSRSPDPLAVEYAGGSCPTVLRPLVFSRL
ncbi:NIPSNAP family protein [Rhizobium sp. CG5]|uniref:NIPSNAP family protein n=1 Tax=Rhizobium sp. CG5 TaxID=2726076 RepID=UPI002034551F|nr:NIPSNAP family protein [Rhizobium sp. CG5]MCM2477529.1 NIPSNAP family protein [Rhizobium sp. CG5]